MEAAHQDLYCSEMLHALGEEEEEEEEEE